MAKLPLIVGLGGINAAGRSSGFHSYKRLVCDALEQQQMQSTWQDLANRMGYEDQQLTTATIEEIKSNTLIRRLDTFDPDAVTYHYKASLGNEADTSMLMKKSRMPQDIPSHWQLEDPQASQVKITLQDQQQILVPGTMQYPVSSAGTIPHGFDPASLYNSRYHPRGLSLTVYGASDAINSLGMEWQQVLSHITPDQVSVYAGSGLAQIEDNSIGGMVSAFLTGDRVSSKMMAMSLAEMPADFINGYMLNSVGSTGTNMGACATFLYNLRQGISDIQSGKAKVVVVGNAEAPVNPQIMEGFRVMGALAQDDELKKLDNSEQVNNNRACRPFSDNAGFTIAESSQFIVLMEEELALELGATIYGSVADVFINADANKKSISAPGVGNYITVAKAAALAKAILGEEGVKQTFVQAHGTGTPQNRVTESHILNEVAKTFDIDNWPVAAVKSYLGHSISAASGDQLISALGVWQYGWIPGIQTIDHIAEDVFDSNLDILMQHKYVGDKGQQMRGAIINSKGFGGNNASSLILSPQQTLEMLSNKYGEAAIAAYQQRNQQVLQISQAYDQQACAGNENIIYSFGESVMGEADVTLNSEQISLSAFGREIPLPTTNPFSDYSK